MNISTISFLTVGMLGLLVVMVVACDGSSTSGPEATLAPTQAFAASTSTSVPPTATQVPLPTPPPTPAWEQPESTATPSPTRPATPTTAPTGTPVIDEHSETQPRFSLDRAVVLVADTQEQVGVLGPWCSFSPTTHFCSHIYRIQLPSEPIVLTPNQEAAFRTIGDLEPVWSRLRVYDRETSLRGQGGTEENWIDLAQLQSSNIASHTEDLAANEKSSFRPTFEPGRYVIILDVSWPHLSADGFYPSNESSYVFNVVVKE